MRFLCSLLMLAASAVAADYVVNGRVIVEFSTIPANRVAQVRNAITNQYNKGDLFQDGSTEFNTQTNAGVISGSLMLDFALSNKSAQVWTAMTNYNFPNGVTGQATFHMCAISSSNSAHYWPCYSTNAFYFQKSIP